jgi:CheY-like chemotaxis protein
MRRHRGSARGGGGVSGRSILLVEDDQDQVLLAMRALRKHGIVAEVEEVVVARDGEEALDYLLGDGSNAGRDAALTPEFVLLDVKLPKLDGLQVLERLRDDERTEFVPVILFSSSREHEDVVEGYKLGANSYVAKPANFERFSEAMRYLGWYWLNFNETP